MKFLALDEVKAQHEIVLVKEPVRYQEEKGCLKRKVVVVQLGRLVVRHGHAAHAGVDEEPPLKVEPVDRSRGRVSWTSETESHLATTSPAAED